MEADAKRLQAKEEDMMKRKQDIRNHLTQLKKERRDLRTAVEAATGTALLLIKSKLGFFTVESDIAVNSPLALFLS